MKAPGRYYEKLTPQERTVLTIEALARRDVPEADRLADSCALKCYEGADIAYSFRLSALHRLALIYQAEVLRLRERRALLVAQAAIGSHQDVANAKELIDRVLEINGLVAAWHVAWRRFIESEGYRSELVLEAFGMEISACSHAALFDEGVPPQGDTLSEATGIFKMHWSFALPREQ